MRKIFLGLLTLVLLFGGQVRANEETLNLLQLGQETCLQMVDYGGALLVETLEGLYMQREGDFVPLGRLPSR